MTKQRLLFCKEYIIDLNATQAAIRAKYSKHTAKSQGNRLLTYVDIQEEIQRLMNKRAVKAEITADDILNDILDTRETCKANMTIHGDYEGKLYSASLVGRNKANELLGKHLKLFTDKVETINHNLNEDVTELTSEERKARIKELMEKNKNG